MIVSLHFSCFRCFFLSLLFQSHTHVKNKQTNKQQTQPESVPISTRIHFKHGDMRTIIEMIRSFGMIVSGEKVLHFFFVHFNGKTTKTQTDTQNHTGEISMEKSEIRNTGRTPKEGVGVQG